MRAKGMKHTLTSDYSQPNDASDYVQTLIYARDSNIVPRVAWLTGQGDKLITCVDYLCGCVIEFSNDPSYICTKQKRL